MNETNTNNSINTKRRAAPTAQALLDWYAAHRRHLPWREDPSPYHVWLSEIMLQQTRVEAVLGYYERFLTVLPDIQSLAAADENTCLKLWEGLGYYSRVRNLRRAAIQIMTEHGGHMPRTSSDLQKLAGIGTYTSAAIASICFNERIPAIDGNLLRVFSRMTGYGEDIKADAAKRAARDWYLEIFPSPAPADHSADHTTPANTSPQTPSAPLTSNPCGDMNQALMDLGATICLPNGHPLCGECPWSELCCARGEGRQLELPVMPAKKKRPIAEKTVFLIYYDQKLALRRRPARGLLAGLYEFPNADGRLSRAEAAAYVQTLGFSAIRMRRLPAAKHIFTHREWHMSGWEILADECESSPGQSDAAIERGEAGRPGGLTAGGHGEMTAGGTGELTTGGHGEMTADGTGELTAGGTEKARPGSDAAPDDPSPVFLVTASELDDVYTIPSAFARYQAAIRRDYL